jgi:hypothetical protein
LTPVDAIRARNITGGTGDEVVNQARAAFDSRMDEFRSWIEGSSNQVAALDRLLNED